MKAHTALILLTLGLSAHALRADVPSYINYQGSVVDSQGNPIGGAGQVVNRHMAFKMYDAANAGALLWAEEQVVTLNNGLFSTLLGAGVSTGGSVLPAAFTGDSTQRFLEITVDQNSDGQITQVDQPISPRQQLTTSAYAFRALMADSISSGVDMKIGGSTDSGLGFYDSSRLFGGLDVEGPVLFGSGGGRWVPLQGRRSTWRCAGIARGMWGSGWIVPR